MTTEFEKFLHDQKKVPSKQGSEYVQRKRVLKKIRVEEPNSLPTKPQQPQNNSSNHLKNKPELAEAIAKLKTEHPRIAEFVLPMLDKKYGGKGMNGKYKIGLIVVSIAVIAFPFLVIPLLIIGWNMKGLKKKS